MPEPCSASMEEGVNRFVRSLRQEFASSFGTAPLETKVRTSYRESRGTRERVKQHHLLLGGQSMGYTEHPVGLNCAEDDQLYASHFKALRYAPWVLDALSTSLLAYSLDSLQLPDDHLPLDVLYATYRKLEDLHTQAAFLPYGQRLQLKYQDHPRVLWTFKPMVMVEQPEGPAQRVFFTDLLSAGRHLTWLITALEHRRDHYLQALLGA